MHRLLSAWRGLSRGERLLAATIPLLCLLAAAVRPAVRALAPSLAVAVAVRESNELELRLYPSDHRDPWGSPWRAKDGPGGGGPVASTLYSAGPDRVDGGLTGDDVAARPARAADAPRVAVTSLAPPALLMAAFAIGAFLLSPARRAPRAPDPRQELLRAASLAAFPALFAWVLVSLAATSFPGLLATSLLRLRPFGLLLLATVSAPFLLFALAWRLSRPAGD